MFAFKWISPHKRYQVNMKAWIYSFSPIEMCTGTIHFGTSTHQSPLWSLPALSTLCLLGAWWTQTRSCRDSPVLARFTEALSVLASRKGGIMRCALGEESGLLPVRLHPGRQTKTEEHQVRCDSKRCEEDVYTDFSNNIFQFFIEMEWWPQIYE